MKYLVLAAALAAAHPAWADVAIAFGDCSAWGVGSGRFMSDAEHRAYEFCRQSGAGGCRIIARGRGECVYTVLQEGRRCGHWWGMARSERRAQDIAIAECRGGGGRECRVVNTTCN